MRDLGHGGCHGLVELSFDEGVGVPVADGHGGSDRHGAVEEFVAGHDLVDYAEADGVGWLDGVTTQDHAGCRGPSA